MRAKNKCDSSVKNASYKAASSQVQLCLCCTCTQVNIIITINIFVGLSYCQTEDLHVLFLAKPMVLFYSITYNHHVKSTNCNDEHWEVIYTTKLFMNTLVNITII